MRVLVTGGAGFIGSNLVHALVGSHEVGVIDDLSTGHAENLHPAAWNRTMDILDELLPAAFAEFAPDAVVHLAAQSSVPRSIVDPVRDWAVNVDGTSRVAAAAAAAGARRVLSASSAAVYGEPTEIPLKEGSPTVPVNPYGSSKLAAETALAEQLGARGVDFASFRFSNVYGPRQDSQGEGGVVAIFCSELVADRVPIIHGSGEQTRDFIYVADVVAAIVSALEFDGRLADGAPSGSSYNISTGEEVSINGLANAMRQVAGFYAPYESATERAGDVMRSSLDPGKAYETFGWRSVVPLDSGLGPTFRWFARS